MQKILSIKEEVDTTHVDARARNTKAHDNIVRLLCSPALPVLCLVFVSASFLQNLGKRGIFSDLT